MTASQIVTLDECIAVLAGALGYPDGPHPPGTFPVRRGDGGRIACTAARLERIERYDAELRGRCTAQQAAWDLGVCKRTIERYEAALRVPEYPESAPCEDCGAEPGAPCGAPAGERCVSAK